MAGGRGAAIGEPRVPQAGAKSAGWRSTCVGERARDGRDDELLLVLAEGGIEGQRYRPIADLLGDGQRPAGDAEGGGKVGEPVDRAEVHGGADPLRAEAGE